MSSKYGSRSYSRQTKQDRGSLKFDKVLSENKPSTAKVSMTAVHRWGNASYTSIRQSNSNGEPDHRPAPDAVQSKSKKMRVESPVLNRPVTSSDPFDFELTNPKQNDEGNSLQQTISPNADQTLIATKPVKPKRNKFFKSRNLFDSLKNGPSFNNDSINYSKNASENNCESNSAVSHHVEEPVMIEEDSSKCIKTMEAPKIIKEEAPESANHFETNTPVQSSTVALPPSIDEDQKPSLDILVSSNSQENKCQDYSTGISESSNQSEENDSTTNICLAQNDIKTELVSSGNEGKEKSVKPVKKFFMNRNKKSSSFQSKSPSKATFKMKLWEHEDELETAKETDHSSSQPSTLSDNFSSDFDEVAAPPLRRFKSEPTKPGQDVITSVLVGRTQKPLYTVVRNVKQAHQCHESGETQEFNDDIDYLIDGLEKYNTTGTRCLSALSLATKCMIPSFRMHLRAHGTIPKLFSALQDAPSDSNVAFCSATLMFVLSQDRLNMDLDSTMLELMLQLMEVDSQANMSSLGISNKELQKNKEKVKSVCEQMQQKSHAKHLNLDHITTGELAMETLLSLTSKRAGEWFKEEIRELGGLDHIIKTVSNCVSTLNCDFKYMEIDGTLLDKLSKVSRCFRVLENISFQNVDNQAHLIAVQDESLVKSLMKMMRLCDDLIPLHNVSDMEDVTLNADHPGVVLFNCLQATLRVLVNLTNNNPSTSGKIGMVPGVIDLGLSSVLKLPAYVPIDKKFDLCVLSLGLLINLVESSLANRKLLMETETILSSFDDDVLRAPAMEALVQLFTEKFEEARQSEEQTDKLLGDTEKQVEATVSSNDPVASQQSNNAADDIEETLMKALKKAGKHMEHSIVGAYTALLVGFVIQDNEDYTDIVREYLPEGNYKLMVKLLRTLYNFMVLTVAPGITGVKTVKQILEVLESS